VVDTLLFSDATWDFPFFKKLAANDTGEARGHQGGMVIPKDLRKFFPVLRGYTTSETPTVDHNIKAMLFVDGKFISTVTTRYQIQTWGGTRDAESRLTSNLAPLRNQAGKDDYLIIQRSLENLDLYRLNLIRKTNPVYRTLADQLGSLRWGLIDNNAPVTQDDIESSYSEEKTKESNPFQLFEQEVKTSETRSKRIARSIIFRLTIQKVYGYTCAICGICLKSPLGSVEIDAAHIVPKNQFGTDDVRNGLALCKRHHWAFDHGLFSIDNTRKIIIPASVRSIRQNSVLSDLQGNPLKEANEPDMCADSQALEWHRDNILLA